MIVTILCLSMDESESYSYLMVGYGILLYSGHFANMPFVHGIALRFTESIGDAKKAALAL